MPSSCREACTRAWAEPAALVFWRASRSRNPGHCCAAPRCCRWLCLCLTDAAMRRCAYRRCTKVTSSVENRMRVHPRGPGQRTLTAGALTWTHGSSSWGLQQGDLMGVVWCSSEATNHTRPCELPGPWRPGHAHPLAAAGLAGSEPPASCATACLPVTMQVRLCCPFSQPSQLLGCRPAGLQLCWPLPAHPSLSSCAARSWAAALLRAGSWLRQHWPAPPCTPQLACCGLKLAATTTALC